MAAVAAVGPSPGDLVLAPEADAAVAAPAGLELDLDLVNEHGIPQRPWEERCRESETESENRTL